MTAILQWMRTVLPRNSIVLLFAVLLIAARGTVAFVGQEDAGGFYSLFLGNVGVFYALFRALRNNPAVDGAYLGWLLDSPWKWPQPLPRGPVLPVWQDGGVLFLLGLLNWETGAFPSWHLALIVMFAYALMLSVTELGERQAAYGVIVCGMAAVHFRDSLLLTTSFVLAALASAWLAGRRTLQSLQDWDVFDRTQRPARVGWPYLQLAPVPVDGRLLWIDGLSIGGMLAGFIWLFLPPGLAPSNNDPFEIELRWTIFGLAMAICGMTAVFTGVARLYLFHAAGLRPPLSLMGRGRTGRWFLPRYDRVWMFALPTLAAALLSPLLILLSTFTPGTFLGISAGLTTALVIALPPSGGEWWLTGEVRIGPSLNQPSSRRTRRERSS